MPTELRILQAPTASPPAAATPRDQRAPAWSFPRPGVAELCDQPRGREPDPETSVAWIRLALTRDAPIAAEAFVAALSDPLVAAERGTFDRMARELRAAYAAVRAPHAARFAAHLDATIAARGEPPVEWAPPTIPPLPANGSSIGGAAPAARLGMPRDGTAARPAATMAASPTRGADTPPGAKEETIVSSERHQHAAPRAEGAAPPLNDWRAQLAAVAAELPADRATGKVNGGGARRAGAAVASAEAPRPVAPEATSPPPDLATLSARRLRLVETDREQRSRAEAALAERQTYLDQIARHGDDLAAIRRERDLTSQELSAAFTDEARAGLAGIAAEIQRLEKACVAALATDEWSLARLERRPEVAALLARRGREGDKLPETTGAAGATRRLSAEATTVPPVAVSESDKDQVRALVPANESPNDQVQTVSPRKVGQIPVPVKRATALDLIERARQLLRAGDADAAIGLLGGLDARGLDREVERQAVGVLFAAAEAGARAGGMDDFRFLRLDRGTRVLLACEPAADYRADDATAPVYRVVAAYGRDGDRFAPGEAIPAGLLERAQPRRARS